MNAKVFQLLNRLANQQVITAARSGFLAKKYRANKDVNEVCSLLFEDFDPNKLDLLVDAANKLSNM